MYFLTTSTQKDMKILRAITIVEEVDNFIQLFLGWEGVGLASYLLINLWFTWLQANKAAIKAWYFATTKEKETR
jgi:NADH:ubiquinone oxidoreductase subunit 5 (subunit L)/multisubunit Na+/H+ antiporter MnhA subunit